MQGAVNWKDDFKASKHSASIPTQDSEPFNKSRINKKKKQHRDKKNSREPTNSIIPTFGVNTAEVKGKKKRNKKDVREITCYNYIKKRYHSDKYPKLWRAKNWYQSR